MIPLARWLLDTGLPLSEMEFTPPDGQSIKLQTESETAQRFAERLDEELSKARLEWEQAAKELVAAAREEEHRRHVARELETGAAWTSRFAGLADAALKAWKDELADSLGLSLCGVLRPFLSERATQLAKSRLVDLLCEELAHSGDTFLELRAPGCLHDDLRAMLERNAVRAALSESAEIEFVTRGGTTRFEELSRAWMECIMAETP